MFVNEADAGRSRDPPIKSVRRERECVHPLFFLWHSKSESDGLKLEALRRKSTCTHVHCDVIYLSDKRRKDVMSLIRIGG